MNLNQYATAEAESYGPNGPWFHIVDWFDLEPVFRTWATDDRCLLLDSATITQTTGRYTFLMSCPREWRVRREACYREWEEMHQQVRDFHVDWHVEAPPFCGGVAGLLSYDWCRALEKIAAPKRDDFQVPTLALGIYDSLIAWDHLEKRCWLIATGYPVKPLVERRQNALKDLNRLAEQIRGALNLSSSEVAEPNVAAVVARTNNNFGLQSIALDRTGYQAFPPEWSPPTSSQILTASPLQEYRHAIQRAKEYLEAGDIFQVNLSQQMVTPIVGQPSDFYLRMRHVNPAPMMGYFDLGTHQIVSASPERLYAGRGRHLETRPIKGTCPRTGDVARDTELGESLRASEKNCAENVMIVDLLRNDLSRVCEDSSVVVSSLCEIEQYQFVQHLTSCITGTIDSCKSAWDVIPAIFPGGSISGAPKIRAMEIINELEPVARGAYCGSLGYITFDNVNSQANADWSILIRTATVIGNWCQIPVGGGIVLDSEPDAEFVETMDKAKGMFAALDAVNTEGANL